MSTTNNKTIFIIKSLLREKEREERETRERDRERQRETERDRERERERETREKGTRGNVEYECEGYSSQHDSNRWSTTGPALCGEESHQGFERG